TSAGDTRGTWDADRLMQVFSNLIGNAVQHGTGTVRVRVDGLAAGVVVVQVQNDGVIADSLLGTLFEPMAGGASRRDGSRGLGLGLYITQQIIMAHRGTIEVRSSVEHGTAFTIRLPRATA
ncbi:MAG TPA: ATP-binding protein, partial [Myxococcota bacterium]